VTSGYRLCRRILEDWLATILTESDSQSGYAVRSPPLKDPVLKEITMRTAVS
jgi:hypothetical protein